MTNFDYLRQEPKFNSFSDVAIAAEKILKIDKEASVINCRRAMEFAIKWMYSVDDFLEMPYQDNLISLMSTENFHDLVDDSLWKRLNLIRKIGNRAAHNGRKITEDEAILCLKNLFIFMDYVSYCYSDIYEERQYDLSLLTDPQMEPVIIKSSDDDVDLKALIAENKALKEELTAKRAEQQQTYVPKPLDLSEYKTRKIYIDSMLLDAGWTEGKDWLNEVELPGMPNKSEVGFADYVLYDDSHRPLAIVEAKRTCADVAKGRQQAKLYADLMEAQYNRRPVVFLTNGFETRIIDNQYPERKISVIYSKRDLEKLFNLRTMKISLNHISIDKKIAGRYYQEGAIKAVCDSFDKRNRRKALLVMATGSGKTRTVIALCKVLLDAGWVKNILFLADRNSLVTQAKRNFVNLLPDLSCSNIVEEKNNYTAHCIFSTYQTMMNVIDSVQDDQGKIYTCGHFDLVICDEAHRSIYNKYRDIFNYFDAPLVGLTATPKDEIDKNTYGVFDLENGVPTYGYELAQAVKDGYLVDFITVETKLKFIEDGIAYDELSEEDKEAYEATFEFEDGKLPEKISSSALNTWIFNEDTIKQVLNILMKDGLKVDYGEKIGKTIIFAKNHNHAEKILEVFNKQYPELSKCGQPFAKVIDNYMTYAQSAIDEFSDPQKMPQLAISVDMLDTGIDVPEVLNLVFFKKVMSKAKFWQMIGRGTRLCPGLMDEEDKSKFYIFDFCGNFEFFRMNQGRATANIIALQGAIFTLKFEIAYKLQDLEYQVERLITYREKLVRMMVDKVQELNRENFAVRQHLKYVDIYSVDANYNGITFEDTLMIREELAPLILPDQDEASAVRFDALVYGMELAYLAGKGYGRHKGDLFKKVNAIASVGNIPEIQEQAELIKKILHTDYVENAGIDELESIRLNLRNLMKYLSKDVIKYDTNFTDEILSTEWKESELENDELKNYKAKAEFYVRQHQDTIAIAKLKTNKPLTEMDVESLEQILWEEVGSKDEYEKEYGPKPLGEFVREIVGLDMNTAKEAFSVFLNDINLDSRQIYFVNQIVEYIVHNGMMKDLSVLQESPFTDKGSIVEIFTDFNVWMGIRTVIDQINANAAV
ncbi:Type-1 restriction enzyme R protein [uncultured Roseburia sp.]|uniref:DEAD/DEAH box helicase family protein n=1 Tax=Brotonthovivens ammoniilytica TaxID=2981725 RepID=A0ABT2TLT2_9FIRM|nr:DEAD/DEAH box helicase family protein [Brotonthovivens ammoniilytica]MCU6763173.1 DEAD/DEAH box helicase family protein [Brotonthovivens ammoniilytica]SCJ05677.1 Type-1 restriction enzyme R protein [uncultured Roseburia sp.]